MTVYRTLPSSPEEIVLTVQPATFLSRLWLFTRQRRGTLAIFALAPLATPVGLAMFMIANDEPGYAIAILTWGVLAGEVIFFGPVLLDLLLRSISPRAGETLLPHKLVLREDSIEVTPRIGRTTVEKWTWIPLARETRFGFVLVLSENPYVELPVPRSILSASQRDLLRAWLRRNGCL